MSDELENAILKALKEEKKSPIPRAGKTFLYASILSIVVLSLLHWCMGEVVTHSFLIVACLIWILILLSFWIHFLPQPRIMVRGYWTPVAIARLLLVMTLITILQIIICPELAALTSTDGLQLPIFSKITDFYMGFGGMKVCMFLCGLTFSGASALVAFSTVKRVLSNTSSKGLFFCACHCVFRSESCFDSAASRRSRSSSFAILDSRQCDFSFHNRALISAASAFSIAAVCTNLM
jgi:hypothetical protein